MADVFDGDVVVEGSLSAESVTAMTEIIADGLRVGPNTGAPAYNYESGSGNLDSSAPFDLFWDAYNRKLHVRNVVIEDTGDPPDLVIRRGGEDATGYPDNVVPSQIENGTSCGSIYWEAWASNGTYGPAIARILARAVGAQTATNNGGCIEFFTTPEDAHGNPVLALTIADNGDVEIVRGDLYVAGEKVNGAGVFENYTPTLYGVTLGAGSLTARWCKVGQRVTVSSILTFASNTVITSNPEISLPVPSVTPNTNRIVGSVSMYLAGVTRPGVVFISSTTKAVARYTYTSGGYPTDSNIDATHPFTVAAGMQIMWDFTYEAAVT